MTIQIRVENDILGNSVFWRGEATDIEDIRNICARVAAERLIRTGITQREGMWIAEYITKEPS